MKSLIAVAVFLWTLGYANAADFVEITNTVKLKPKPPVSVTVSTPVEAEVNVHQKFSSIGSICFRFAFQDDLLDPGDDLEMDIGGFFNPTGEPQSARVFCPNPDQFSKFLDGKIDLTVITQTGSVTISSLSVTITGDSRGEEEDGE
jgi:hypothetical protein